MVHDRKHLWILAGLLGLGVIARVYFAFCFRHSMNSDYGIVALMVKHIVEGRDFPVFFYGQAYMGSFEPLVSALFCKLFGLSAFNVCLGTAFLGFLLLPVVYAWGRDAGGKIAGLAALAFAVIGPVGYFHYLASPRGGYAATLLLGTLVLWLSGRIAVHEFMARHAPFKKETVSPAWYALLGLIGGVGWWTNQLMTASLLTAAVALVCALKTRVFTWRTIAGLLGFLIGSLPWWLWNIRHSWESLGFMGSLGQIPAGQGLKLFFVERLMDLMDLPPMIRIAGLMGLAALAIIAAWTLLPRGRRHGEPSISSVPLLTVFIFVGISALLFCRAHFAAFNTARYLLPIVPALAVLVGVATAVLTSRLASATRHRVALRRSRERYGVAWVGYGLGWCPLALALVFQIWNTRFTVDLRNDRTWEMLAQAMNRVLGEKKIDVTFCDYKYHWLNFATGEANCFADIIGERYPPYEWRGETARHTAFLDNVGNVAALITNSGGSARCESVMGLPLYYDLQAPTGGWRQISAAFWTAAIEPHGSNVLSLISDGDLETRWEGPVLTTRGAWRANAEQWIEIRFKEPVTVQGCRFIADNNYYPPAWAVDGKRVDDQPWQMLTPVMPINGFFWSGPRLFWNGLGFRPECRFKPETVSRLRVRFMAPEHEDEVYVSELMVFGLSAEPVYTEEASLDDLLALLKSRGVQRLYSDRWMANEVYAATVGEIVMMREPAIVERRVGDPVRERKRVLTPIRLDPHTAILVRAEEAPVCRKSLKARRIEMRETAIGPWILLDMVPSQWDLRHGADTGLYWTGFNVLVGKRVAKQYAAEVVNLAERASSEAQVMVLLEEAVREAPEHPMALQRLAARYRACGDMDKAVILESRLHELTTPQTPARVTFMARLPRDSRGGAPLRHGIEFLGLTLKQTECQAGDRVNVRYYWRCPPEWATAKRPIVFAHFRKGDRRFQDDHLLLADLPPDDIVYQASGELLIEKRSIAVPLDAEPGPYDIQLGLIDAGTEKRWLVRTELPTRHRAVTLPVKLHIK